MIILKEMKEYTNIKNNVKNSRENNFYIQPLASSFENDFQGVHEVSSNSKQFCARSPNLKQTFEEFFEEFLGW